MNALDSQNIIGVIGAGTMGTGIAQIAADNGHTVKLYDICAEVIEQGMRKIQEGLQKLVERGRKQQEDVDQLLARINPCQTLGELSDCSLVIEAVLEDLQTKQQLFQQLEQICDAETILASNTSSISITAIGTAITRPENLLGMHFFNPAPIMKLVEVISGLATAPEVKQCIFDTVSKWGKIPVMASSSPGFIVNRVARSFYAEPLRLLAENAAEIATIDTLFKDSAGFRIGPFELMDLIGNDVNYAVTESVYNSFYQDSRFQPSVLQKERVDGGFLGRKSGRGWYDYCDTESKPQADIMASDYRPQSITVRGELGVAGDLISLAEKAGITVQRESGEASFVIEGTMLALTDGRSATNRSSKTGIRDLVLFDLMASYADNHHIALAKSKQASEQALQQAVGFFNALGKTVSVIDDTPGLCVMRTVCMLINEGADAVYQGVCDIDSIDKAMQYGVNYPLGPMRWADQIGLFQVQSVLHNLQQSYGQDRYRCSLLINRLVEAGENFFMPEFM